MKNETIFNRENGYNIHQPKLSDVENYINSAKIHFSKTQKAHPDNVIDIAEILVITSYPPRVCGIATYSHDLIKSLNNKFSSSLSLKVCALESGDANYHYPGEVKYILNTSNAAEFEKLASDINTDNAVKIVLIQHEFGFYREQEPAFLQFLYQLSKPVIMVFHTVLPHPDEKQKAKIRWIAAACTSIVVMTENSAGILTNDYGLPDKQISVIAHGTHLVLHVGKKVLKAKYGLKGRKVLTTFGLLGSGKSIETTLEALPAIVEHSPEVMFLIIGETHPEVRKADGEKYREKLEQLVMKHALQDNVRFVNNYLELPELLEYLQLTDIYLFTTNDPNQAVSGTFVYAMSCACPIISTPIPHAREVLTENTGIIFDFLNSKQLAEAVIRLLSNETLRRNFSSNTLQKIAPTAWENSAVAHAMLFKETGKNKINIRYNLPVVNLNHIIKMTTDTGIIQFSKLNHPDISSGYTLDDNARALVSFCMYYKLTGDEHSVKYIRLYLGFIKRCQQSGGNFLNYVGKENNFTDQNNAVNLDDANGRAVWALGYATSLMGVLPYDIISRATSIFEKSLANLDAVHSTRAMAFAIKGLYYYGSTFKSVKSRDLIETFANRLVQMYKHESGKNWEWFESYLTYANSILPDAMLYAWLTFGKNEYKDIARASLNFLIAQTFNERGIEVISNRKWLLRGDIAERFGEQPIDVAYTIMTLGMFGEVFKDAGYLQKMQTAFNWFLGNNRLHQIVYNPCTGGCYDGLEETQVNLNQGAESTVSYLLARLTMEKYNLFLNSGNH